mgnify:CR=1 FL=1
MKFDRKVIDGHMHLYNWFSLNGQDFMSEIDDFREKLLNTLKHMVNRKGWKYMGVWERAPKTNRLHFHGLFNIPDGTMPGEIIEVKEEIKQDVEEYKINNQMINKLKEIIKNNETEDMKNYGYEIVVDSSIVELTNQFTLTEQRVINKIRLKYGTIRIYSQDYYFNGEYITTQCFII